MSTPSSAPRLVFPAQREKPVFWDTYPHEADAFTARVDEGIVYSFRLRLPRLRSPKDTYEGISRSAVGRDLVFWLADPEGFEACHDEAVVRAIEEFKQDRHDAMVEWRQGTEEAQKAFEEASRLPTPPLGFQWVYRRRKWVPWSEFRLAADGSGTADPRQSVE